MSKFALGCVFYQDVRSLERTLRSFYDKVDYMFCIDGRYKHFGDDSTPGLSTDGSRELVQSFDNAVLVDVPDAYEIQKRQKYLDLCGEYDIEYLIIADSDEYVLEYNEHEFKFNCASKCETHPYNKYNIFSLYLEVNQPNYDHIVHTITGRNKPSIGTSQQFAHHPRLWRRPYEVMYKARHYNFVNKDPKKGSLHHCETMAPVAIIQGIKLGHNHLLRNKEFLDNRLKYQTKLVEFEQKKLRHYIHQNKRYPDISEYDKIDQSITDY